MGSASPPAAGHIAPALPLAVDTAEAAAVEWWYGPDERDRFELLE